MKIENISVSDINIDKGTAILSFNIVETTTNVDIDLKINDDEFIQIATNQGQGNKTYTLNSMQKGVHNLILKISNEEEEYISEPFLAKFKINPTIENLECIYSDSTGKFILRFTILGDELFTYNINLKLDNKEYQEVMTSQIMGEKTLEAMSKMGSHTCVLKISDGYDEYETDIYSFEITNQRPILSKILVANITNEGTATIYYAVKDIENSQLIHMLNIDGRNEYINPTKVDDFYTYELSGLSVGKHVCNMSITDGIDVEITDDFYIEIFANSTDKKEILRQSKIKYDFAYQSLKDIITSVISDGVFDYDIENMIIKKAQESYNETYSEFNRIAQQSIDIIGTNKVNLTKEDLTTQINDVDNALNTLETTMEGVFRDGLLSDSEKTLLRDNLNLIAKEKADVDSDYETLYNNEDLLDPAKSKLQTTYNAFVDAQNSLATTINNIINKDGIIDNEDKASIDSAFEAWRVALGDYRNASLEAIDSIAKKKIDDNADTLNERWSELIVDIETGIRAEVGSLEKKVNTISETVDVAVKNVEVMYYLSTSETSLEGGEWTTEAPTWEQGKYMWSKTVTTLSNDEVKESNPVCIAGAKGQDATTYYTWIMYADDENGNGISNSPDNKKYIGFAYNKTTQTESTNRNDYTWSLIKGEDGKDGTDGTNGINGQDGKDGITYYTWIKYSNYADGTSLYDTPNDSTEYIGIAVNQTSQTESTNKSDYKWSKFRGDDGVNGSDGDDGVGVESVTEEYYLSTSKTTQTGGSWVTSPPTWSKGYYMWTRSKIVYTNGVTEYTDPICDSSWEVADEVAKEVEEIDRKVATLEITNESITSTVSSMQSTVNGFDERISSTQQTANKINWVVASGTSSSNMTLTSDALNIISSNINLTGKVTFNSFNSSLQAQADEWDASYNTVYNWAYGYPSSTNTTTINGAYIETGTISADKIMANSISVDMLKSNNANPIIRLFDQCSIDATLLYEKGQGDGIRLKWDNYNYIYVSEDYIGFHLTNGGETYLLALEAPSGIPQFITKSGYKLILDSSLTYKGETVVTSGNVSSYCAPASHTHSGYASSSHNHSGTYAPYSHTHSYAPSSHSHDSIYYSSSSIDCYSSSISISSYEVYVNCDLIPGSYNKHNCGTYDWSWRSVVADMLCYLSYVGHADGNEEELSETDISYNFMKQYSNGINLKQQALQTVSTSEIKNQQKEITNEDLVQNAVLEKANAIYEYDSKGVNLYTNATSLIETMAQTVEVLINKIEELEETVLYLKDKIGE